MRESGSQRRGALTATLALAALATVTPLAAQVQPPGAPPPRPGTRPIVVPQTTRSARDAQRICAGPCPTGAAPTSVSASANGAFEVSVEWTPSPWATSHTILRAATAAGPFEVVGTDTNPGPLLAVQRAQQQAEAKPMTLPNGQRIMSSALLVAQRSAKMLVNSTFTDRRVLPQNSFVYKVHAQYAGTDSVDAMSGVSIPVTTATATITGLSGETDASLRQVMLMWDEPPVKPSNYMIKRNGTQVNLEVRDFSPGRKLAYDDVAVDRTAPPTYEVTAFFSDGSRTATAVGTVTVTPKAAAAVAWCRKVARQLRIVVTRGPLSSADLATATFPVTVTAVDSATGAAVQAAVSIRGGGSQVATGMSGQPMLVRVCTDTRPAAGTAPISTRRTEVADTRKQVLTATACGGTVSANGFGSRSFSVSPQ